MSKKELIQKLDKIVSFYKILDSACDKATNAGCLEIEGPLWNAIWKSFEGMLDMVDFIATPEMGGWISWYIYDNQCGEKEFEAKSGGMKKSKKIRNTKDLAELILKDK